MSERYALTLPVVGAPKPQTCLQFRNDIGFKEIRIGVREFECIGQTPPQDHPHIYLEMGEQDCIRCPYCDTIFRFDSDLTEFEAEPPDCSFAG